MIEQLLDVEEWKCITDAKYCAGQDRCYFNLEMKRCPSMGFKIRVKKVGVI